MARFWKKRNAHPFLDLCRRAVSRPSANRLDRTSQCYYTRTKFPIAPSCSGCDFRWAGQAFDSVVEMTGALVHAHIANSIDQPMVGSSLVGFAWDVGIV